MYDEHNSFSVAIWLSIPNDQAKISKKETLPLMLSDVFHVLGFRSL